MVWHFRSWVNKAEGDKPALFKLLDESMAEGVDVTINDDGEKGEKNKERSIIEPLEAKGKG